jgi:hypothetical protein
MLNRPEMKIVRIFLLALLLLPSLKAAAQSEQIEGTGTPVVSGGCVTDFTWVDSLGYVFFIGTSSLGNNGVYFWDFGDASYSSQQYPSHNYAGPGTFQVCLLVTDSTGNYCDSACHAVSFNSVSINENVNVTGISLAPNPADDNAMLSFTMTTSGNAAVSVYDITGREIKEQVQLQLPAGKQQFAVNTHDFASGIYFIQIIVNDQLVKTKLIVTHKQ